MAELLPIYFSVIAFFCALGAMALAIFHIYKHLLNYTEPTYQRYIVRIIFMVPVYALLSFLSLIFPESSIYFNSICEVYEAWVIYNFLSLYLAWVGGPGAVVLSLSGRAMKPSWCLMTCSFPPMPLDGRFIRREFWFFWLQSLDSLRMQKKLLSFKILLYGNKMDELSSYSSSATSTPKNDSSVPHPAHSDAMKSSHLMGASDSLSSSYDMSLIDMDFSNYPAKVAAANETGIR